MHLRTCLHAYVSSLAYLLRCLHGYKLTCLLAYSRDEGDWLGWLGWAGVASWASWMGPQKLLFTDTVSMQRFGKTQEKSFGW